MKQRRVRTGIILVSKRDGSRWEVLARVYNEVIMRHIDCVMNHSNSASFTWDEIADHYEIESVRPNPAS